MLVHKFGGTSVADAARIEAAARLITQNEMPAAVVTSAMAGVTDKLIDIAHAAKDRRTQDVKQLLEELRRTHYTALEQINGADRSSLEPLLDELFTELDQLAKGVRLLQELTPRSLDLIQSFGERLAAPLLAAAIQACGTPAQAVDARDIIRTDDRFGRANVDVETSRDLARRILLPITEKGIVPVVTGFTGRTADGLTTTLGRGGSDYSATLVGSFIDAAEIIIWTDVQGVMTADPRLVPEARVLESISYREAAEMAYFGSKVLHPNTMIPAIKADVPIRIRSSFDTDSKGTLIAHSSTQQFEGVKSVTSISDMTMVTVEGRGMIGVPGVVGRVFAATARAGVNVFMISQSSSEQNISFIVQAKDGRRARDELQREFDHEILRNRIDDIDLHENVGILAIIGEGMKGTPGISRRLFTALGRAGINVLAIAQGSSELNVSVVVEEQDLHRAVGATHTRFGLTSATHVFLLGKGLIGRTLIGQLLDSRKRLKEHGLSLNVIGVCGRHEILMEPHGISEDRLAGIAKGTSLLDLGGEKRPPDEEILQRIDTIRRLDVALVDVTAAETGPLHLNALEHGIHVITANKKPLSGSLDLYRRIRSEAFTRGLGYHFETTFGAGLPVLFTLQDLLTTHDRIHRITGCFSGTLGYICSGLQKGRPFSEMVLEAGQKGFTEPDPRDDLSGMDVARKALIIAREMGAEIEMSDLELEPMIPQEMMDLPDVDTFMSHLHELDDAFVQRVQNARDEGKVLRYLAEITHDSVSVGLTAVDIESPAGRLDGPDNILVYRTERYRDNPLVIQGPGAGAEVTAAGVFGDLLKVARHV